MQSYACISIYILDKLVHLRTNNDKDSCLAWLSFCNPCMLYDTSWALDPRAKFTCDDNGKQEASMYYTEGKRTHTDLWADEVGRVGIRCKNYIQYEFGCYVVDRYKVVTKVLQIAYVQQVAAIGGRDPAPVDAGNVMHFTWFQSSQ